MIKLMPLLYSAWLSLLPSHQPDPRSQVRGTFVEAGGLNEVPLTAWGQQSTVNQAEVVKV